MAVFDLLDLPSALPPYAPVIGLDLGEKTIGVAVSDATMAIASPLELIRKGKFTDDANRLFSLMEGRGAKGVVIGLPVNMDGSEGRAASPPAPSAATCCGSGPTCRSPSGTSACRPPPCSG
jgi:putative Holliday junction resolvase